MYQDTNKFLKGSKLVCSLKPTQNIMKAKSCMTEDNHVFSVGDYVLIVGVKTSKKIVALISDDNSEYIKNVMVCDGRVGKIVPLKKCVNLSDIKDEKEIKVMEVLSRYDFYYGGGTEYTKGVYSVELDEEDGWLVWRLDCTGQNYRLIMDNSSCKKLKYLFDFIDCNNLWDRRSTKRADI